MSLFERIQNKRYDLQEAPIDDKGRVTPEPGEIEKSKKIVKKYNRQQKKSEQKNIKSNQEAGENIKRQISQRRTAQSNQQQIFNRQYDAYDDGDLGNPSQTKSQTSSKVTTGKGVNQADVSKDAKKFTKKINKQRIEKQGNIFGGQDKIETKRKVGSNTPRGTRTKTPVVQGQKKLNLGTYTKGKVQPTQTLKPGGMVKTDLRTVKKKYQGKPRPKRSPLAKPPKPEKMVVAKDPIKGGFRKVGATTTQGSKVLRTKQSISTDELLGNQKKIEKEIVKNKKKIKVNKNTPKPNLFSKVKGKLKDFHKFMVKDAGTRKTSEFAGYGRNITRTTYKNTLKGNTLKNINKVLPGKYKALAAIATGAYLATRGKKKDTPGGVTGGNTKFTGVNPGLKLDTGKKNT